MEKAYGPTHPQTLQVTDHLGMVLAEQGKKALAASVFKKALDGYVQAYGPKHPQTLGTMSNYANALRLCAAARRLSHRLRSVACAGLPPDRLRFAPAR